MSNFSSPFMKFPFQLWTGASVLGVALLLLSGCSREAAAPAPLPMEQVPTAVTTAFDNATPEIKAAAADFVASVKGNEIPAAFEQLQDVTSRPDLTPAQRATGARAMMSVAQQLQAAAANGDAKAAEALKRYQGSR